MLFESRRNERRCNYFPSSSSSSQSRNSSPCSQAGGSHARFIRKTKRKISRTTARIVASSGEDPVWVKTIGVKTIGVKTVGENTVGNQTIGDQTIGDQAGGVEVDSTPDHPSCIDGSDCDFLSGGRLGENCSADTSNRGGSLNELPGDCPGEFGGGCFGEDGCAASLVVETVWAGIVPQSDPSGNVSGSPRLQALAFVLGAVAVMAEDVGDVEELERLACTLRAFQKELRLKAADAAEEPGILERPCSKKMARAMLHLAHTATNLALRLKEFAKQPTKDHLFAFAAQNVHLELSLRIFQNDRT